VDNKLSTAIRAAVISAKRLWASDCGFISARPWINACGWDATTALAAAYAGVAKRASLLRLQVQLVDNWSQGAER
jgi:hypothetical protein